ncbi:MAG: efflux RND transporter periplasmic adaptor subunit [Ignavibacterium sp.]|nr:efflux RND transporter periplasmic adaptor subunit [Ignavibacterium sp.]
MNFKIVLFAAAMIVFISGCSEKNDNNVEKPVPVMVYKVGSENISEQIVVTGSISATEDVMVYSKISEKVDKIYVKPGDKVGTGKVVASQYSETLKQGVEASEAALKTAEVQLDLMNKEYERMESLFKQKAISQQQFDQVVVQKKSASYGFEQTKAMLKQSKEMYENSFIRAPFNGTVASVFVEKDQMIGAGMPVVQIINPSSMKAKLKLASKDAVYVKKGQKVDISFPSIKNKKFVGIVTQVNEALDQLTKTLEVEVTISTSSPEIKSGLFGEFGIKTNERENVIVIPENAVLSQTEVTIDRSTGLQKPIRKYFVFLVKNGKAEIKEIFIGIKNNSRLEVKNGLSSSDTIIVIGQNIVKAGQTVKIIE